MPTSGWKRLLADPTWCRGRGKYPIPAYSEFMPPPRVGLKPYGWIDATLRPPGDNFGWNVTEYEQAQELQPGLRLIAREVLEEIVNLGTGRRAPQISRRKLRDNPYWPPALATRAGHLKHERYVILLALALSRTQDDKGRVRWTLFGSSEQGPATACWKGFYSSPRREIPEADAQAVFQSILTQAYGVPARTCRDLERAGLRILPIGDDERFPDWADEPIPRWAKPLIWKEGTSLRHVRFLLTFRAFDRLPAGVQQAYVDGVLHLLPFPGSLVFWGAPRYRELQRELPFAMQIPLLHLFPRHNDPRGIRIPQSGWLDERGDGPEAEAHTPQAPVVQRTHRWQRVHRDEDETPVTTIEDRVTRALFSTAAQDLGLYGKPMARNVEIWNDKYHLLFDGPRAASDGVQRTEQLLRRGGQFGYRFVWPAMRVGTWEVYWHRPLLAFPSADRQPPVVLANAPAGYLTAYDGSKPSLSDPIELWPRLLERASHRDAVELFDAERLPRRGHTAFNIRALLEFHELLGGNPLPRSFARNLIAVPKGLDLDGWLDELPDRATDRQRGARLAAELRDRLEPTEAPPMDPLRESLTFHQTATRDFEVAYWKTIATLAHGRYRNKDNADWVNDVPTRAALQHRRRDLEALGAYLIRHHAQAIRRAGLEGKAWVSEHAFRWQTDFRFAWSNGWAKNQSGKGHERNLMVRIPGRDRSQAIIMADHYDTAYMEDVYDPKPGGTGARVAAAGADDNHSATAALMLAAPFLLDLSKTGRLGCDVWLVHLTGEEFPSDCMGARHLAQALVERSLKVKDGHGRTRDLSRVQVRGVYVADMIAHNNDRDRNVFQIAPGEGAASARLALTAYEANQLWNGLARAGNATPPRRTAGPFQRSDEPNRVPPLARFAELRGEIRPEWDPRSALFNTDGQIFSDAGIPVVLFMEDYDINQKGYHDTHDTMKNIDLDYGAALAAIFIETVARAAAPLIRFAPWQRE